MKWSYTGIQGAIAPATFSFGGFALLWFLVAWFTRQLEVNLLFEIIDAGNLDAEKVSGLEYTVGVSAYQTRTGCVKMVEVIIE